MIKKITFVLLLLLLCCIIFFIFKVEIENEKFKNDKVGIIADNTALPTPDRIIYKNKNNEYIIINNDTTKYAKIYSELYNRTSNIIDGKVYTYEQISEMQNKESFVEFDYNTKSKNFVFMLEEDEIGIIKRLSDSGQVISTSLEDKEKLIKILDNLTKNEDRYDFNIEYNIISENVLSQLDEEITIGTTKVSDVYQKKFTNKYDETSLNAFLKKINFNSTGELPNIDLNKQNVIITVSRYEIKNINKSIGNIKYDLGDFLDNYIVNVYIVSKVVNINCIYFNNTVNEFNVDSFSTNNKGNAFEYYVQNGKYYANINNKKTEIISLKKAADIADTEAKKQKYQYQEWKSEFYSRDGYVDDNSISAELILGLDDISRLYHWTKSWQNEEYDNKVMWKIRLFDRNDPLTNLYIYIDALNGNIIGAGAQSD